MHNAIEKRISCTCVTLFKAYGLNNPNGLSRTAHRPRHNLSLSGGGSLGCTARSQEGVDKPLGEAATIIRTPPLVAPPFLVACYARHYHALARSRVPVGPGLRGRHVRYFASEESPSFWSARQNMHFARLEVKKFNPALTGAEQPPKFAWTRHFAMNSMPSHVCENHARKMRTFFTRRLEPKTRSSYHIKWSNAKWNTLKQNTSSSLLKTKLSQNYSTLTQVRSRTKEFKLTLHAVVVFWLKQTKQRKHRVGTPSIPSRERTTPREPKFHTPSCSSSKLPQIWDPDNGKFKFQANLLSLQPN